MAGQLKRENPDIQEDLVLIRALRDSNLPKFLADDATLFKVINLLRYYASYKHSSDIMCRVSYLTCFLEWYYLSMTMVFCSLQLKLPLVTEDYRLFKNRYVYNCLCIIEFSMDSNLYIGSLHVLTSYTYNVIAYNSMFVRRSVSYILLIYI